MSMTAFVVSPSDLSKLQQRYSAALNSRQIICSSLLKINELQQADRVYFVISKVSMCSTAFQELVFAALAATEGRNQWLLPLDEAKIPLGFSKLLSLPKWEGQT